jgi:hypothetical protein
MQEVMRDVELEKLLEQEGRLQELEDIRALKVFDKSGARFV